jgi:hypothetical protein
MRRFTLIVGLSAVALWIGRALSDPEHPHSYFEIAAQVTTLVALVGVLASAWRASGR